MAKGRAQYQIITRPRHTPGKKEQSFRLPHHGVAVLSFKITKFRFNFFLKLFVFSFLRYYYRLTSLCSPGKQ